MGDNAFKVRVVSLLNVDANERFGIDDGINDGRSFSIDAEGRVHTYSQYDPNSADSRLIEEKDYPAAEKRVLWAIEHQDKVKRMHRWSKDEQTMAWMLHNEGGKDLTRTPAGGLELRATEPAMAGDVCKVYELPQGLFRSIRVCETVDLEDIFNEGEC